MRDDNSDSSPRKNTDAGKLRIGRNEPAMNTIAGTGSDIKQKNNFVIYDNESLIKGINKNDQ